MGGIELYARGINDGFSVRGSILIVVGEGRELWEFTFVEELIEIEWKADVLDGSPVCFEARGCLVLRTWA